MRQYYVGYEKTEDGYKYYTIYPEAVELLLSKIEFNFDATAKIMVGSLSRLCKSPKNKIGEVVFFDVLTYNKKIPPEVRESMANSLNLWSSLGQKIDDIPNALQEDQQKLEKMGGMLSLWG